MTEDQKKRRLAEIGELMKTAKGKELDRLTEEVDRIVGLDVPDQDPERDAAWEAERRAPR